ncbi:DUF4317 domain-containing protein [Clostridium guangxiense]|nr:DUF4317 domain-containing protein [Clostridium guangxiense]
MEANKQKKKEERLQKKVQALEEELEKTKQDSSVQGSEKEAASEVENDSTVEVDSDANLEQSSDTEVEVKEESTENGEPDAPNYDVVVHVKPEKVDQIKSQIIDGKKCIVIPMDDDEQAKVNGVNTLI